MPFEKMMVKKLTKKLFRAAATREAAGMILMPVPHDLIGAVFCSDKYRDHLLKKNKFMNQFLAPITTLNLFTNKNYPVAFKT